MTWDSRSGCAREIDALSERMDSKVLECGEGIPEYDAESIPAVLFSLLYVVSSRFVYY